MNAERTMQLGQLAEAEHKMKQLAIAISGLKKEMRIYLAEHAKPEELEAARVGQLAEHLRKAHEDFESYRNTVTSLRDDLGLPRYEAR